MATGQTTYATLSGELAPKFIAPARMTLEQKGVMEQLVDSETLPDGEGEDFNTPKFGTLTAQAVTEGIELNNPQLLSTTSSKITPGEVGIEVLITDKTQRALKGNIIARAGELMGDAMARKLDQDLLGLLDGFSTSLVGANTALKPGYISAGFANITGNTTEPGQPPVYTVLHPFSYNAMIASLIPLSSSAVGNPVPKGISEYVLENYFKMDLFNTKIFTDGNLTIDSSADVKSGMFARRALQFIKTSKRMSHEEKRIPGARSTEYYVFSEYGYGEYQDAWGVELYCDATAPTS